MNDRAGIIILGVALILGIIATSRRRHHDYVEDVSEMRKNTIDSKSRDPQTHFDLQHQTWWLRNRLYPALGAIAAAVLLIGYFLISKRFGV